MPIVIVDGNEAVTSPKTVENLRAYFPNLILGKPELSKGIDVQIILDDGSKLAIERKAPKDFLASIGDGRLKEQVENMFDNAKYVAVVITGKFNYANELVKLPDERDPSTNWKSTSVRGMLRSVQMAGCILEFCPSIRYGMIVREIYDTCNTPDHRQGLQKHRIITFPPIDERIQLLGQLPGVGVESAESLLRFAGKMDKNADEDGFGTVAGALHWLSIMAHIAKDERPKNWNANKILTNRKLLGLESNQYITIKEE